MHGGIAENGDPTHVGSLGFENDDEPSPLPTPAPPAPQARAPLPSSRRCNNTVDVNAAGHGVAAISVGEAGT